MKTFYNLQEEEQLANEVQKYPCLYDKSNPTKTYRKWFSLSLIRISCNKLLYTPCCSLRIYIFLTTFDAVVSLLDYVFFYVTLRKIISTNVFSIHLFKTIALFHNSFILITVAMSEFFFVMGTQGDEKGDEKSDEKSHEKGDGKAMSLSRSGNQA